jgi:L-iditol 2-dehydrogenase
LKKMRAALFYGTRDVRVEEIAVPYPGPGEVLVKVKTALTCGTDLKTFVRGSHPIIKETPSLFGHEFAGVVEAVGEGVAGFEPGMRVVAANSAPCGSCFFCLKGRLNLCENLEFLNGAYAEYIRIPKAIVKRNLHVIPEGVSNDVAALSEPLACVLHGIERTRIEVGDTVAVIGAGPIGLMFVALARRLGARTIVIGRNVEKLARARHLGADHVISITDTPDVEGAIRDLTDQGRGVDVVIEAVGLPEIWERAMSIVRKGGTVNLFGGCERGTYVKVDTYKLHYHEMSILSVFHHTPRHMKTALSLIAERAIPVEKLFTHEFDLGEIHAAFAAMEDREALKIVVRPGEKDAGQ